uniref:Uncharacterized protein n=1 Tax=Anguilla anguilla TaxID=7936 RepID=A0A0E9V094_ANGAN
MFVEALLKFHPVDSKTGGQCEKSGKQQIACNCLKMFW